MQNLTTRIISALVYASIFLFSILFSAHTYMGLIIIFAGICLWEFQKIINFKNIIPYVSLVVVLYFLKEFSSKKLTLFLLIITLLYSLKLLYKLYYNNKNYSNLFLDKLDLCIRYIVFPFSFLALLPFIDDNYQPNIIIYIILLIWTNDSFAYLIGKNFGKTKLFETISPKKTIEGFWGGFVFSIIIASIISKFSSELSTLNWIIIAVITSVFGTFGDLVESKFKRQANVKDSGKIMPGHGGLLDRLDSLFFVAPFVYLYVHYII